MADDPVINEAIQIVQRRYSVSEWAVLPPQEITAQIYQEVRRLDLIATGHAAPLTPARRAG